MSTVRKLTPKELYDQYQAGKSVSELSQETGKGEWAIRKQIQRYRNKELTETQNRRGASIETASVQIPNLKKNLWTDFGKLAGAIAVMLAIYFLYMAIKKKTGNSTQRESET